MDNAQDEPEEETAGDQSRVENDGEPPAKRQKTKTGPGQGRVADGQDFWSQVDAWFKKKIDAWGDKFSCDAWAEYAISY